MVCSSERILSTVILLGIPKKGHARLTDVTHDLWETCAVLEWQLEARLAALALLS